MLAHRSKEGTATGFWFEVKTARMTKLAINNTNVVIASRVLAFRIAASCLSRQLTA